MKEFNQNQALKIATAAAYESGVFLKREFKKIDRPSYVYKSKERNIVSRIDKKYEQIIIKIIRSKYPDHSIYSEEAGLISQKSDYLWIIDPLDGTTNFVHKIPHFCVSIALSHKRRPIIGIVYNPLNGELFTALAGYGAKLNGRKLQLPANKKLKHAL